jgi:hypothetical protein
LSQAETDAVFKMMKDRPKRGGGGAGKQPPRGGPGGQTS